MYVLQLDKNFQKAVAITHLFMALESSSLHTYIILSEIRSKFVVYANLWSNSYVHMYVCSYVMYCEACSNGLYAYACSNQTVGGWSREGILQDTTPGLPVLCTTSHLTSFAVLVSTAEMKVRTGNKISDIHMTLTWLCIHIVIS